MRKLICGDCGKAYDYDKDDFCPKCGSYNAPVEHASTQLERDQMARFADGKVNQDRGSSSQTQYKPSSIGAALEGHGRHGARFDDCERRPKNTPVIALAVVGLVLFLLFTVVTLVNSFSTLLPVQRAAPEPDYPFATAVLHQG